MRDTRTSSESNSESDMQNKKLWGDLWVRLPELFLPFFLLTIAFNFVDWVMNAFLLWVGRIFPWISLHTAGSGDGFFRYGEAVAALIAAVLVIKELQYENKMEEREAEAEEREAIAKEHESKIQQATFIKDFNQAFIANSEMATVERKLEEYYDAFRKKQNEESEEGDLEAAAKELEVWFGKPGTENRQALINYLVYLEGLATVIRNEAMKIENVDSLMGYRFFLAVNNPVVQDLELLAFPHDYREIHELYNNWLEHRKTEWNNLSEQKKKERDTRYGDFLTPMQKDNSSLEWAKNKAKNKKQGTV